MPTLYTLRMARAMRKHRRRSPCGESTSFTIRARLPLASLKPDEDGPSLQFVRLVQVADNGLLKQMCSSKEECVVSEDAGLFIEVAATCPAYYSLWDENSSDVTHEVRTSCDRKEKRNELLSRFGNSALAQPTPLRLTTLGIASRGKGVEVKVAPGVTVVRPGWYTEGSPVTGDMSE